MLDKMIGRGVVLLSKTDFHKIPTFVLHKLPNTDMYENVFQFKFKGMDGNWYLVDIVHVNKKDEVETGVNFLVARIEDEN